jgi:hypothetical protein
MPAAKAYKVEWKGEALIAYGRNADGSETAIEFPPGGIAGALAIKPAIEQKGEWAKETMPLRLTGFQVGSMPLETPPLVSIKIQGEHMPVMTFGCSVEQARELADRLQDAAMDASSQGSA